MKRQFYILSESWYGKDCLEIMDYADEIMFGLYSDDDVGTSGEMAMRWVPLGVGVVPQLQVFDDGWGVLSTFSNVIAEMGNLNGQNITPMMFVELLKDCGFEDRTERTQNKC